MHPPLAIMCRVASSISKSSYPFSLQILLDFFIALSVTCVLLGRPILLFIVYSVIALIYCAASLTSELRQRSQGFLRRAVTRVGFIGLSIHLLFLILMPWFAESVAAHISAQLEAINDPSLYSKYYELWESDWAMAVIFMGVPFFVWMPAGLFTVVVALVANSFDSSFRIRHSALAFFALVGLFTPLYAIYWRYITLWSPN